MAETEIEGGQSDVNVLDTPTVDVSDRCNRLLGQLCYAGSPIDPRAIRALSALTDSITVYGSQNQQILQTPVNFNSQVELATGATLYDARQIRFLLFATDSVNVSGSSIIGTVTANAGTNLNTSALALETGNLATIAGKDFATQTTLSAINAKLVSGTDIGDVTINNAIGASAVNIQDGGNTITVDGTVTATVDTSLLATSAKQDTGNTSLATIAGAVSATHVQVDVLSAPAITGTVTANAGTNLNTSTLAKEAGGNLESINAALADRLIVGNAQKKFRDGFAEGGTQPDPTVWDLVNDAPSSHIVNVGGNAMSSAYLRISLSPFITNSGVSITTKDIFGMAFRVGYGLSVSQRIVGQEIGMEIVGVNTSNVVETITPIADKAITGTTISITTNVGTVTLTNHGLKGGDRISIYSCPESRLNVGPFYVTGLTADTFSVPITLANGTYSCVGGYVKWEDPVAYARNAAGLLCETATTTAAYFATRRNGSSARTVASTISTTTATQANTSPYTDAFLSASNHELFATLEEIIYRSYASDGVASMSGIGKRTQSVPDEEYNYKIRVRAKNLKSLTVPVAKITAISKTGTTTATVTTSAAHGLNVLDYIQIYGVRDIVNFPNLTAQTVVSSVVNATTFTVIIGTATTTSSAGGVVWRVQGSVLAPGVFAQNIQSISRTNNILSVVGDTTWATPLPGEYVHLYGMDGSGTTYDEAYKVLRVNTSTLELESTGSNFGSINCGGSVIRRTDVRINFVRVLDYTRLITEIVGGRGNTSDINNAVPVSVTGSAAVSVVQSTGYNTTAWSAAGWGGFLVADVASAAITTTATTAAVSPGSVVNVGTYAHSFNMIVTAVSGTTPTFDLAVEESPDNGTNWIRIYEFQRITATGAYTSPVIRSQFGTRFRYVQTIGGTTPSFTRAINRIQFSHEGQLIRQFFDRSIVLTTLNSVTPTYNVDGCDNFMLALNLGAATTPPVLTFEGSEDNATWYILKTGATLTGVASSTVVLNIVDVLPKFVRARVSTIGVTVTPGYVSIKAKGMT